jgi:hypothetical protein
MAKKDKKPTVINGEEATRQYKKPMPVELSDGEKLLMVEALGKLTGKLKEQQLQFKTESEEIKGKIKETKAKIQKIEDCMETGTEDREVEIAEIGDFKRRRVDIYRVDVDPPEKIDSRAMRPEEAQVEDKRLTDVKPSKAEKEETKN